ncbi:hypothetical protein L249_4977 [Ophiocordyceps polyrhachis-furcata BCC 54312]|uniref:Tetratricopeptide repeat protein 1 n=1 Tax=Ophiocordyceps polyrhachis-furcata BCC 54312 TaxID=1330021 RepID=A0A367L3L3_9HYPO|nr:hypothetical protein L249_4977 [Ophiocordyceps polyrhachis-furcata BCC 54312]
MSNSTEEEARECHAIKAEANALFAARDFHNALARYDDALESCPRHRAFDRAVLLSNVAAAHLQLEQWTDAIKSASDAIRALDGEDMPPSDDASSEKKSADDMAPREEPDHHEKPTEAPTDNDSIPKKLPTPTTEAPDNTAVGEEIISSGPQSSSTPAPAASPREADIARIRIKALLRRARARSQAGGWQNLSAAEEDYRALAAMPGLTAADARSVRAQLKALPPRTKAAQEAEMSEMWGKLRHLGDGILKPFGLSTQNFQMVKDEKTGGYSVNFNQGQGPSSS